MDTLRAAAWCRTVRVSRNPARSHLVTVDVVRRDPLAAREIVTWEGLRAARLSIWDPVHVGVDEHGRPVRVRLLERNLLVGGEPGSGKSSLINLVAAHAALSPDCVLVLMDGNRVQLGPWRRIAERFAGSDITDAISAWAAVRAEMDRRYDLLDSLPGVNRKITPELAARHGLVPWVVICDEAAFYSSVTGDRAKQREWSTLARDAVARGRASGVITVLATQRPTSEIIPTSLRDLFGFRCAMRCTTNTSSDVILGEGWANDGYSATDIDPMARGVGWLRAEDGTPARVKAAWLSDENIGAVAERAAVLRADVLPVAAAVGAA